MSNDPHRISLAKLADLLVGLGLDADVKRLKSVSIESGKVTVVRMRLNENGRTYVLPGRNEVATETVTIAVVQE